MQMKKERKRTDWGQERRAETQDGNARPTHEGRVDLPEDMDTIALSQYLATRGAQSDLQPEKKLMLAMLQDAIDCFRKNLFSNRERKRALFEEADAWIMEENDRYLFSFENICEVFDIDPGYLRKGLTAYKRKQDRRAA